MQLAECQVLLIILLALATFFWATLVRRHRNIVKLCQRLDGVVQDFALDEFRKADGFSHVQQITVVIPALNEKENLKHVLPRIPARVCNNDLGVLIVDDGSSDGTSELSKDYDVGIISTPVSRGGGAALRLGYRAASIGGAKIIVTMDADGQNKPEEIERLVEPIIRGKAEFVIGSRLLGYFEKDDPLRLLGVRVFNPIMSFLGGKRITDCSSGFRAMSATALQSVLSSLQEPQYHSAELHIAIARSGVKLTEVPISFLKRISGHSKKGNNLYYGYAFAKTILITWWRSNGQKHRIAL
jgi:glycosyltransferase involved in cell wall biosynthesis